MKTIKELTHRLAELKNDERMTYVPANVQINVVLALIQVEVGAKIHALEWALDLPLSKFPLKKLTTRKK